MKRQNSSGIKQISGRIATALTILVSMGCSGGPFQGKPLAKASPELSKTVPTSLTDKMDRKDRSPDRVILDDTIERAKKENKSVILEYSAAWCGPCTQFAYDFESHPEYAKQLADKGYIFVKAERELALGGAYLNLVDYLPFYVRAFPSFYLYNQKTGWKKIVPQGTVSDLMALLADPTQQNVLSVAELKAHVEQAGASGTDSLYEGVMGRLFVTSVSDISAHYGYTDAVAIIKFLTDADQRFANLHIADAVRYYRDSAMPEYVAHAFVSLSTLASDFPEVALDLTDVSRKTFSNKLFAIRIALGEKNHGPKAMVKHCPLVWQNIRRQLVAGSFTAQEFDAKLASLDAEAALVCSYTKLRGEGATPQAKVQYEKDSANPLAVSNWFLEANLGDRVKAAEMYHKQYLVYSDSYTKALADLNADLGKATAAGDQAKIASIQSELKVMQFQIDYHASVDANAEDAIKTGRVLTALKVLN